MATPPGSGTDGTLQATKTLGLVAVIDIVVGLVLIVFGLVQGYLTLTIVGAVLLVGGAGVLTLRSARMRQAG